MGRRCLPEGSYAWLPSLRPGRDDWQTLLDSLAELYVRGAKIDWAGFDRDYPRRKTELPTYPFQRRRYWANAADRRCASRARSSPQRNGRVLHPLAGPPPGGRRERADLRVADCRQSAGDAGRSQDPGRGGHAGRRLPGNGPGRLGRAAREALVRARRYRCWSRCSWTRRRKTVQTILTPEGPQRGVVPHRQRDASRRRRGAVVHHARHRTSRIARRRPTARRSTWTPQRGRFTGEPRDEAVADRGPAQVRARTGTDLLVGLARTGSTSSEGLAELRAAQEGDQADDYQIHPGLARQRLPIAGRLLARRRQRASTPTCRWASIGCSVFDRPQGAGLVSGVDHVAEGQRCRRRRAVAWTPRDACS